ncbi:hypothetical protein IJ843_04410 [bacterium]|nr:hypothetical protein [bacterium]
MICRKCGAEILDNSIRCSNCGIKVNMYCPKCRTLNAFGEKYCVNCGTELLLYCSVCGTTNIYYATDCRKCHSPLIKSAKPQTQENKDVEVVESFSADESAYSSENNEPAIKVTHDNENNGLPVIEKTQKTYSEADIKNVFGHEEEFVQTAPTVQAEEDIHFHDTEDEDSVIDNNIVEEEDTVPELTEDEPVQNLLEEEQETLQNSEHEEIVYNEEEQYTDEINSDENEVSNREQVSNEAEPEYYQPPVTENLVSKEIHDVSQITVQKDAVVRIANLIKNSLQKHVIAVNGAEGSGKSAVLKQVSEFLSDKGYLSLYGSCTPLVQITSFGFFQDAFLRIMGFPPYATSMDSFVNDFKKSSFAKVFSFLDDNDLTLFLNMFYPSQKDNFDNIIENKMKIFSILEKVIKSFLLNNNLVILIDNFELLDGASYDFIVHMIKNGFFNNRLKLVVAYQDTKDIKSYFELSADEEKMFETVEIAKFTRQELLEAVERNIFIKLEEFVGEDTISAVIERANGNAIRMEQEVAYLFDTEYLKIKDNKLIVNNDLRPSNNISTFEELIKLRINTLPPNAKNVLFMAAIMGYRFAANILCLAVTMPVEKAESILNSLIKNLFVQHVDNYTCEFKSLTLWKLIYQEAKADLLYKENAQRLYAELKPLILSSNLQKLISCTEALSANEEYAIWQNTANITAKLGDTNLYVIALKQCLKLMDEQNFSSRDESKQRIYEEMGKLLCEKSPQEAVTYLSNVLDTYIKESNVRKVIDISGYFVKSCYLTGNYFGASEAVDAVLNVVRTTNLNVSPLEIALIKTRKLSALLNIGNSEQIINLTEEEILPEFERTLSQNQLEPDYKNIVLNALLNSKITLAKAYAMQGNNKVNNIIADINDEIVKYNYNIAYYKLYSGIIEAFAKTLEGDIHASNEILNNISLAYKTRAMEPVLLAWWNLISIINRVLLNQSKDLKVDLFELAAFANNINEHFIKNIVKLILGYVLKKEGNPEKAEEIYQEQIVYFAKEKVAIGALLTWSLIVQKYLEEGDTDRALSIAGKSLEIAQDPKINNYFFIICFQKYIAEIYSKKADFAATKMYLEKSIIIAKQFNLKYQLIELYVAYAQYIQELMKDKKIYGKENIDIVHDMYKKAVSLSRELALQNMIEYATREYSSFKTYCQLNSIEI